jgi:hypothetical protein
MIRKEMIKTMFRMLQNKKGFDQMLLYALIALAVVIILVFVVGPGRSVINNMICSSADAGGLFCGH